VTPKTAAVRGTRTSDEDKLQKAVKHQDSRFQGQTRNLH
jgi:hypothetical protein